MVLKGFTKWLRKRKRETIRTLMITYSKRTLKSSLSSPT